MVHSARLQLHGRFGLGDLFDDGAAEVVLAWREGDIWLRTMIDIKYKKVTEDPEMFATYLTLAQEACEAVRAHKERLVDQVAHIIADGVKQGAFQVADVRSTARAVFEATVRYHHPAHADDWKDPSRPARIDALLGLLLRGLEAPRKR